MIRNSEKVQVYWQKQISGADRPGRKKKGLAEKGKSDNFGGW